MYMTVVYFLALAFRSLSTWLTSALASCGNVCLSTANRYDTELLRHDRTCEPRTTTPSSSQQYNNTGQTISGAAAAAAIDSTFCSGQSGIMINSTVDGNPSANIVRWTGKNLKIAMEWKDDSRGEVPDAANAHLH
jgi:hypothetical protein